jgi:PilZ domain
MTEFDNKLDWLDDARLDRPSMSRPNTRIAVRYILEDINANAVCTISMFNFGFLVQREFVVQLFDISSKGLLISTDKKLSVNQEIYVCIKFEDGYVFKRHGKIVRKANKDGPPYKYGLQFDRLSNSLGEYLLATQKKLTFK